MNLKFHLLIHIILVAVTCLILTTAYVLFQADQQEKRKSTLMLESITKQLEVQLLQMNMGLKFAKIFPDFSLWKETQSNTGVCLRFIPAKTGVTRRVCRGTKWSHHTWPDFFETAYRSIFNVGFEDSRQVIYKQEVYGVISVTLSIEKELNHAWESLGVLLKLSAMTLLAVCLVVYFSISRALRPAQIIVSGLKKLQSGDLSFRLPDFELAEWHMTRTAINALAASQQALIAERKQLTAQLLSVQEEERRFLARELHDELGQCLASINALTASMTQTAEQYCPDLVDEITCVSHINNHMMTSVQAILVRLRPADLDELGLALSLNSLISEWNQQSPHIRFQLVIKGDLHPLQKPLPITLFRLIQESLTNINKHSSAKSAQINVEVTNYLITLIVDDDGDIGSLPFPTTSGFGFLGMRERVYPLGGTLMMTKNQSGGLCLKITLPINHNEGVNP